MRRLAIPLAVSFVLAQGCAGGDESAPPPAEAASRDAGPAERSETVSRDDLRGALAELQSIADGAEWDVEGFGLSPVNLANVDAPGAQAVLDDYRRWAEELERDVGAAVEDLPDAERDVPPSLRDGWRRLATAWAALRRAPGGSTGTFVALGDERIDDLYLPDLGTRRSWIQGIQRTLDEAERVLEDR